MGFLIRVQISSGILVGWTAASGLRIRNRFFWKRDKASAKGFDVPKICLKDMLKPVLAAKRYSGLISDIKGLDEEEPESQTCDMGLLSVTKTIRRPSHKWPQVRTAAVIAKSSL